MRRTDPERPRGAPGIRRGVLAVLLIVSAGLGGVVGYLLPHRTAELTVERGHAQLSANGTTYPSSRGFVASQHRRKGMNMIEIPQAHGKPSYASEKEIWRTLCVYCEAIDTADIDGFARLWEHGKWPWADGPGAEPARRWLADHLILYDGQTHTQHQLTNTVIDVDDEAGTATFTTYASIWQALPDFPLQPIIHARFNGTFERVDGRWWWKTVELVPDLVGDTSRHVRA